MVLRKILAMLYILFSSSVSFDAVALGDGKTVATPKTQAQVAHASGYAVCSQDEKRQRMPALLKINSLQAAFQQPNRDGSVSKGMLDIVSPDKMRIEYLEPQHLLIIVNGDKVVMYDFALAESTFVDDPIGISRILGNGELEKNFAVDCQIDRQAKLYKLGLRAKKGAAVQSALHQLDGSPEGMIITMGPAPGDIRSIASIDHRHDMVGEMVLADVVVNRKISVEKFIFVDPKLNDLQY